MVTSCYGSIINIDRKVGPLVRSDLHSDQMSQKSQVSRFAPSGLFKIKQSLAYASSRHCESNLFNKTKMEVIKEKLCDSDCQIYEYIYAHKPEDCLPFQEDNDCKDGENEKGHSGN